jgi:hypothetical protein
VVIVSLTVVVGQFFFPDFLFTFGARSTQLRCFFQDTRPSIVLPVIVRSSRRKLGPRWLSVFGAWPVHAREIVALWRA